LFEGFVREKYALSVHIKMTRKTLLRNRLSKLKKFPPKLYFFQYSVS